MCVFVCSLLDSVLYILWVCCCCLVPYHTEYFHCPKKSPMFCYSSLPLNCWQILTFFNVSTILLFEDCHIVKIIVHKHFILAFFLLVRFIYVFSMHLHCLIFFSKLNNIPLSVCTTVYVSIHLLKGVLTASIFWQLRINTPMQICVDTSLQFFWVNTKECDSWSLRQGYAYVYIYIYIYINFQANCPPVWLHHFSILPAPHL